MKDNVLQDNMILNPIYDTVYKYLISQNNVVKVLFDNVFDMNLCVIKTDGSDRAYRSKNDSYVYYARYDAFVLDGKYKGDKLFLELSRIVSQDCTVHFVFENIGPGGHYRGFIEPITDLDTDFRKVVSLFGSGLYNWKPVIDIDETLYNSPECKTIIDALKQCTTGTQLMQSDDFKRELALHGFVNPL